MVQQEVLATTCRPTVADARSMPTPTSGPGLRVGYLVSRFPELTETFVADEILALERCGVEVELYPLRSKRAAVTHPGFEALARRARVTPLVAPRYAGDHLRAARAGPGRYATTLATLLYANWGSARYLSGALAFWPKAAHLASLCARAGIRHLHAHFASHPAAVGFAIHRLTGLPWSFTAHGSDLHRDRHMLAEKVAAASFVVAISEYNRRRIVDTCGAAAGAKIVVVHCGIDTHAFTPHEARPTPPSGAAEPLKLICVGTLHAVKGQTRLLDACARLLGAGIEVECELVGGGPDRRSLERRAAELGLAGRVRFLGPLARPAVIAALHRADVAVAPSVPTADGRREGIPVALMEAMGCGLPVVASRLSGIPELVTDGDSGFLIEPGSTAELADRLARLRDAAL